MNLHSILPVRLCGTLGALALLVSPIGAQTIAYDFDDGADDFTATFLQRGFTPWTYFTTGGLLGSGSVRGAGASTSAAIYDLALDNFPGAVFTLAIDFKAGFQASGSSGDVMGLGLLDSTDFGWQANQPDHSFHAVVVRMNNFSSQNLTQLGYTSGASTGGNNGGIASFTPLLTTGHWYRLSLVYTNTGADFSVNASLFDIGADGMAAPDLLRNAITTAGRPELAASPSIYVGLYGGTSGGDVLRADRLDNFSAAAVPEPATIALIGLGGVAVMLAARRRR